MSLTEVTREFAAPKIAATQKHTSRHAGWYAIAALVTAIGTALPALRHLTVGERQHDAEIEALRMAQVQETRATVLYLQCVVEQQFDGIELPVIRRSCGYILENALPGMGNAYGGLGMADVATTEGEP